MKLHTVLFSLLLGVSLLGCKKETTFVDTVVWQNDVPHDLAVTVYTVNGEWNFDLNRGGSVVVCRWPHRVLPDGTESFLPVYEPPFEGNWSCDKGAIDSVVFVNAATREKLTTCTRVGSGASYKPLSSENCYETTDVSDGIRFVFRITPKRYAVMQGRCPCDTADASVTVENLSGTILLYGFYAVWYLKTDTRPQKLYMLENLPEQYRQEGLQVSVTGIGKSVNLPEPWLNYFTGGCLSDYTIGECR